MFGLDMNLNTSEVIFKIIIHNKISLLYKIIDLSVINKIQIDKSSVIEDIF